ncbi:MAG TPA: hypothetical protein VHV10_12345 [Ktedonobacteraceae bacterium]|nr:hypothetical protein [Ktedonobacteraceae bacterium]
MAQERGFGVTVVVAEPEQIGQPLQVDRCGPWIVPPTQQIVTSSFEPGGELTITSGEASQLLSRSLVVRSLC